MESDSRIGQIRPNTGSPTLGSLLRSARKAAGRTLRDVEADTGLSKSHLSCVENDKSVPGLLAAARLTRFYGIGLDWLVGALGSTTEPADGQPQ